MKISITYEKRDILALVAQDLTQRGLNVKEDVPIEYKGALSVKLAVDVEGSPIDAPAVKTRTRVVTAPVEEPENVPMSLATLRGQSEALTRSNPGKFAQRERQLGPNESLDFPRDD